MQAVDVLGDDGLQPALPLQLCQPQVGSVGLCPLHNELIPVEPVELLGVLLPEGVAQDGLGRVIVLLVVQAVHAAEIGDAAFGGDPRAAKKDDAVALGNDFFQCRNHKRNASFPADRCVLDSSSITQIQRKGSVSFLMGFSLAQRPFSANRVPSASSRSCGSIPVSPCRAAARSAAAPWR